jgi:hypothetical protein
MIGRLDTESIFFVERLAQLLRAFGAQGASSTTAPSFFAAAIKSSRGAAIPCDGQTANPAVSDTVINQLRQFMVWIPHSEGYLSAQTKV